ncbi:hypothetical protein BD779DRAFT_1476452 [Infundibulicybe gibba]|nr:hypothetical protein BD779DRAFT_1476452 [Infundibulicybe gibba]
MPVPRASRRRLDAARTLAQPERLCRGGDAAAKPRQTMRHTASSYRRAHRGRSNSAEYPGMMRRRHHGAGAKGKWPEEMGQLQLVVRHSRPLNYNPEGSLGTPTEPVPSSGSSLLPLGPNAHDPPPADPIPSTPIHYPARPGQRLRPAHTSTSAERKLKYAPRPRAMYSKKLLATLGRDTHQIAQRA